MFLSVGYKLGSFKFSILFNKLIALISYNNGYTYVYKYQDIEYITELTQKLNIRKCDLLDNVLDNIYLNSAYSLVPKLRNGLNEPIFKLNKSIKKLS